MFAGYQEDAVFPTYTKLLLANRASNLKKVNGLTEKLLAKFQNLKTKKFTNENRFFLFNILYNSQYTGTCRRKRGVKLLKNLQCISLS